MAIIDHIKRLAKEVARSDAATVTLLTAMLIVVGSVAYARIEGWAWLDAVYATIITITTVGYGDLSPKTASGRLFAVFFTFIAIGIGGYAVSTFAAYLIESRAERKAARAWKRRMKHIDDLNDHYILCGADIVGTRIAEELYQAGASFVIVEPDEIRLKSALLFSHPDYYQQKLTSFMEVEEVDLSHYEDRSVAELSEMLGTPYILDDPTDDGALVRAGIGRAVGLFAVMPDDRDNLAIVVGARALAQRRGNARLRIMARADAGLMVRKLNHSGADFVRIPAVISGQEMAWHMLHPEIANWWYTMVGPAKAQSSRMRQVDLMERPDWVGLTIAALPGRHGVLVLAVKRGGEFLSPPPADLVTRGDDTLITLS